MNSRVWSTRSAVLATVGSATVTGGLIGLTWWLLGKGNDGAGIANVLALPLTAFGLIATVWGLNSRPRADNPEVLAAEARSTLAKIITSESRALQRLTQSSVLMARRARTMYLRFSSFLTQVVPTVHDTMHGGVDLTLEAVEHIGRSSSCVGVE
jgi:hypothetical protein